MGAGEAPATTSRAFATRDQEMNRTSAPWRAPELGIRRVLRPTMEFSAVAGLDRR